MLSQMSDFSMLCLQLSVLFTQLSVVMGFAVLLALVVELHPKTAVFVV